jgi:hypothetical protein
MSVEKLVEHFSALEDPRCAGKVEHRLIDILVIGVDPTALSPAANWPGRLNSGILPAHLQR